MTGRAFVDTNVLVYVVGPASRKREQAEALLLSLEEAMVSPQVISEFVSVCLKKEVLPPAEVRQAAEDFMEVFRLEPLGEGTLRRGLAVRERYGLSWWDSLIVAAALEGDCDLPYSEDFQAGQVVEGRLRIENPFS